MRTANGSAVELRLARSAALATAAAALPVLAVAWWAAGPAGLRGAAVGAAVVLGMFGVSGALVAFGARFGPSGLFAATLGGFALRLMAYAVLMVVLTPVDGLHGPSLAIAAAVLLAVGLAWDVRAVLRTPSFFWVDASARPTPNTGSTTTMERTPA